MTTDCIKLYDVDYIEIGTSDFDTEIQKALPGSRGVSVEPISFYLDRLPNKEGCAKACFAISDEIGRIDIYYVKEYVILKYNLPDWVRGCNSVNDYHPTVKQLLNERNLSIVELFTVETVEKITFEQLVELYGIKSCKFLKIDTEGHDCVILQSYLEYCRKNPSFSVDKIQFETNVLSNKSDVALSIAMLIEMGYEIVQEDHDTVLILNRERSKAERSKAEQSNTEQSKNLRKVTFIGEMDFIKEFDEFPVSIVTVNTIPRILHIIWVGNDDKPKPAYVDKHVSKWQELMPDYLIRLWTNNDINTDEFSEPIVEKINSCEKGAQKADIMRYNIIRKYGGIYLDTDIIPHRSFDPLIHSGKTLIICHDTPVTWGYIACAFFAAIPEHPAMIKACEKCLTAQINTPDIHMHTGPKLFGEALFEIRKNGYDENTMLIEDIYFYRNHKNDIVAGGAIRESDCEARFGTHFYSKLW